MTKVLKGVVGWLKEGLEPAHNGMDNFDNRNEAISLTATDSRRNYELRFVPKAYSGRLLHNAPAELLLGISVLTVFFVIITLGIV